MAEGQIAVFEIKEYVIVLRQLEFQNFHGIDIKLRGIVRCFGDDYNLDIYFLNDDSNYPKPLFIPDEKRGFMFVPLQYMPMYVDLLRNEKPLFAHLRGDKPEWTSITTTKEPVGEGEES